MCEDGKYILIYIYFKKKTSVRIKTEPLCLRPEVSHRQGVLHRQGAVDHGADLPQ